MLRLGRGGFTLIEMAIVLVVVGLLLGGAVVGIAPVIQSSKINQTNQKMSRIELALLAYVMQNGCLPCPANGALGSTDASGNAGWSRNSAAAYYGPNGPTNQPCAGGSGCNTTIGVVPWNTLSLKDSDTVDPWQDRFSYAVTSTLTVTAGESMMRGSGASYPLGTLTVNNYGAAPTAQTTAAAYVLISHGRDRSHAYAALNGQTIADPNAAIYQTPNDPSVGANNTFRQDTARLIQGAGYFDDIVRYRTSPAIIQDCGKNACGNPP